MATKRRRTSGNGNGGGHADDLIVRELQRIYEEMRAQGTRLDALNGRVDTLTAEVRELRIEAKAQGQAQLEQGREMRAVRDLLVTAVADDRRRIDVLETRVAALEAGKH